MKQFIIMLALPFFFLIAATSYSQEKVKVKDDKMKMKDKDDKTKMKDKDDKWKSKGNVSTSMDVTPYTASYSSNFSIGDSKYSQMILDLWKDYENNSLSAHNYFSDTVTFIFPDGNMIKGLKELNEMVGKARSSMSSVNLKVDAWVPLHSNDKNTDLVAIWGNETDHFSDGRTENSEVHEVWGFNKDGKVSFVKQWSGKPMQQKM